MSISVTWYGSGSMMHTTSYRRVHLKVNMFIVSVCRVLAQQMVNGSLLAQQMVNGSLLAQQMVNGSLLAQQMVNRSL